MQKFCEPRLLFPWGKGRTYEEAAPKTELELELELELEVLVRGVFDKQVPRQHARGIPDDVTQISRSATF